jgi:hypothetical protein
LYWAASPTIRSRWVVASALPVTDGPCARRGQRARSEVREFHLVRRSESCRFQNPCAIRFPERSLRQEFHSRLAQRLFDRRDCVRAGVDLPFFQPSDRIEGYDRFKNYLGFAFYATMRLSRGMTTPTTFELRLVKDRRESSRLIYSTEGADRGDAKN